jgi:tetratricopeptide (TPR) repeat protein
MRAFVFTNPALTRPAGRFVWLGMNTEKASNASLLKKFPVSAYPTYFIVDSNDETVALRWVGGASVTQILHWLDDGQATIARKHAPPTSDADRALAEADRLYGAGDNAAAASAYGKALAAAPAAWKPYPRAIESSLYALTRIDSCADVVTLAQQAWPRLRHTPSAADVAGSGLDCAVELPATDPRRAEAIATFEAATREVLADPKQVLSGDDRSGLYISLLGARKDAQDAAGATKVAGEWAECLDREAAKAKTPGARSVYDPHRLSAYIELGQPERAIPMLEASQRAMPDDYNPPARLAIAYRAMKKWDQGLAASDRAMALAYGPRKLGFFTVRTDLYLGKADTTAAVRTLEWALAYNDSLPEVQRSANSAAAFKKRLGALKPAAHL